MLLPKSAATALDSLWQNGYEAYVVGGYVRDHLLGKKGGDVDITTNALPDQIKAIFRDKHPINLSGVKYGTVGVCINSDLVEITTYRTDGTYLDGRRPSQVTFSKYLKDDLSRRDFTINALAWSPQTGIIDYWGGTKDLQSKTVRAIGDPDVRFREDALRIFRALRFASTLEFEIDPQTSKSLFANKNLLHNVSGERIGQELTKLLCGISASHVIRQYVDIIGIPIPELLPCKGFDQKNKHHIYNVLDHTLVVLQNVPPRKILRLTALFHDLGKPQACEEIDGARRFRGHSIISMNMARDIMGRLRYPSQTTQEVMKLIKYHDVKIDPHKKTIKRWLNKIGIDSFFRLLHIKRGDIKGKTPADLWELDDVDQLDQMARQILKEQEAFCLKDLAINGDDLIKELRMQEGKQIGQLLTTLLNQVVDNLIPNEKNALLDSARKELTDKRSP